MNQNKPKTLLRAFWSPAVNIRFIIGILALCVVWSADAMEEQQAGEGDYLFSITNGIKAPLRIVQDKQGVFYVTDAFRKCILRFDNAGNHLEDIITAGTPVVVAVSNDNQVVYSDNRSGRIMKIGPNGSQQEIYNTGGYPVAAVFDNDNKLYVADGKTRSVTVLDLAGTVLRTFGNGILNDPAALAFDRKNNRVLVAEHGGLASGSGAGIEAKIFIFDLLGNLTGSFGKFGNKEDEFSRITGLVVNGQGQVYVVDPYQARISVFSENGEFIRKTGGYGTSQGQLNAPMDVCIDTKNRMWITSMNKGSLEVFKAGESTYVETLEENKLFQNYPNPFRDGTWIPFVLSGNSDVSVSIYNLQGVLVRNLKSGFLSKGHYNTPGSALYWDGADESGNSVESGIYFYDLKTGTSRNVRRMILTK